MATGVVALDVLMLPRPHQRSATPNFLVHEKKRFVSESWCPKWVYLCTLAKKLNVDKKWFLRLSINCYSITQPTRNLHVSLNSHIWSRASTASSTTHHTFSILQPTLPFPLTNHNLCGCLYAGHTGHGARNVGVVLSVRHASAAEVGSVRW